MSEVKRFYCTRIEDTGGMRGPIAFHAVTASLPDPALRAQVREGSGRYDPARIYAARQLTFFLKAPA